MDLSEGKISPQIRILFVAKGDLPDRPDIQDDSVTLRIGVNATFLHDKPTGLGFFTHEVSRRIYSMNHDFLIFSPVALEGIPSDAHYSVPSSVRGSLKFRHNLFRSLYLNISLPTLCRRKRISVLFCPMVEFPFIPLVPLVVHVHDLHPLRFASDFWRATIHFRVSLMLLHLSARRVTVSSQFVKRELSHMSAMPEGNIDVVPLAYSSDVYYLRREEEKRDFRTRYQLGEKYILSVGNLFPYKNVRTLIDAFMRVRHLLEHHLVIVGRREFSRDPLPEDARIHYMDYVPIEDLPFFYACADLFVHPSLSEGFGITPLEAMACGTPVISSRAASLPEVVGDAGLLFDPRDVEELSRLILTVTGKPFLQKDLREKGLRRAAKFSWEETARGIMMSCTRATGENV